MDKLRVAILGAGNIAGGYDAKRKAGETGIYSHAGAYLRHGGFELSMVYDVNGEQAECFKEQWRVKERAESPEQIICGYHDVVSICTPDLTHSMYVKELLTNKSCKTVVVEKPLAQSDTDYQELIELSNRTGINIVVNFQRRYESMHERVRAIIDGGTDAVVSVSGVYMKGLRHIGVTLIDSILFLFGPPLSVLTVRRVWNHEVKEYSYDFILFFDGFVATVRTADTEKDLYNYHIFELDILMKQKRFTFIDISQGLREAAVTDYAYGGVRVMNDRAATVTASTYDVSMVDMVQYVFDITMGIKIHSVNTPEDSYLGFRVMSAIEESYERGLQQVRFSH